MTETDQLREDVARAVRILKAGDLFPHTYGHVSARTSDGRVVMLGHVHAEGRTYDTVTAADTIVVDEHGTLLEGRSEPVHEFYLHTEVYRARPDVGAVGWLHGFYTLACSVVGLEIEPVDIRSCLLSPKVPILSAQGMFSTQDAGRKVAQALGQGRAVLVQGQGALVVGGNLKELVVTGFLVEETAKLLTVVAPLGRPQPLPREIVMRDGLLTRTNLVQLFDDVWQHYLAMDPRPMHVPR